MPTYNRPTALARTLDSLVATAPVSDGLELVVVDTGPAAAGAEAIAAERGVRYERAVDTGVSAARNRGAASASGELLLFIDDDIVVGRDTLDRHQAIHAEHERCLVSGHWEFDPELRSALERTPLGRFRLEREDAYNHPHGVPVREQSGRVHPLTLAAGNLSIRRDVFWALDGFDESFPVGAEDQDLSWRARKAGCTLIYDYAIRVIHNDQHTDLEALCRRQERSATGAVYFARKHADAPASAMVTLNAPLSRSDPPRLILRKLFRSVLSRGPVLAVVRRLVKLVESVRAGGGWPLESLYNATSGLYVFRGVRRGFRLTSREPWTPGHRAE